MKNEILLSKSYNFEVIVNDGIGNKFAGKLQLESDGIILIVMGERAQGSDFFNFECKEAISCTDFRKNFLLIDLKLKSGGSRGIHRHPESIVFSEATYDVGYVFCSSNTINNNNLFSRITIHSDTISKWIGNTEKQQSLMDAYYDNIKGNKFKDVNLIEFDTNINGLGNLFVAYNFSQYILSSEFKAGVTFPPSLNLHLHKPGDVRTIKSVYDDLYSIISFLIGSDINIEKISISSMESHYHDNVYFYYPTEKHSKQPFNRLVLFPLSKNIRFDTIGLPSLPINVFNNFFNSAKKNNFRKYLKYKCMLNAEERFLGYFRLLESLTYCESCYLDDEILTKTINRSKKFFITYSKITKTSILCYKG